MKLITDIFHVHGAEYVRFLVQPVVTKIINETENSYEIDISKLSDTGFDKTQDIHKNKNNLASLVTIFMKTIYRYYDKFFIFVGNFDYFRAPEQIKIIAKALYNVNSEFLFSK